MSSRSFCCLSGNSVDSDRHAAVRQGQGAGNAAVCRIVQPGALAPSAPISTGLRRNASRRRRGKCRFCHARAPSGTRFADAGLLLAIAVFTMVHDVDIAPPFVLTAIIFGAVICVVLVTCVLLQFVDVPIRPLAPADVRHPRSGGVPAGSQAGLRGLQCHSGDSIFAVQSLTISLPLDVALSAAAMHHPDRVQVGAHFISGDRRQGRRLCFAGHHVRGVRSGRVCRCRGCVCGQYDRDCAACSGGQHGVASAEGLEGTAPSSVGYLTTICSGIRVCLGGCAIQCDCRIIGTRAHDLSMIPE